MDDYYVYAPWTTKTIKSKPITDDDLRDVDDDSTRYFVGKKIFKVFNDVEYNKCVTGYDNKGKIYHVLYEDGDAEYLYHNEV